MDKLSYLKKYQDNNSTTKVTYKNDKFKDQDNIDILMGKLVDKNEEEEYIPVFVETKESQFINQQQKKLLIESLKNKKRSRSQSQEKAESSSSSDSSSDSDSGSSSSDLSVQRQPKPTQVVHRDAITGQRITQEQKEQQIQQTGKNKIINEKEAILEAQQNRIAQWSRGLVQTQAQQDEVLDTAAHNKRADIELIKQTKFDDPMRQLIQEEDNKVIGELGKFLLKCKFPTIPNRFGIQSGHRWDGVDRSNGFEKKFLENINEKRDRDLLIRKENLKDL